MYISLTPEQINGLLKQPNDAVLQIEKPKIKGRVGVSPIRGELIWIREPFRRFDKSVECGCSESPCGCPATGTVLFKASHYIDEVSWESSARLPKKDSRLTLRVLDVTLSECNVFTLRVEVLKKNITKVECNSSF